MFVFFFFMPLLLKTSTPNFFIKWILKPLKFSKTFIVYFAKNYDPKELFSYQMKKKCKTVTQLK